jgi:CBS domain-containing protein
MNVQEIMNQDIIYVDKDVDMKYVIKLMKKHNITKMPVLENHKPIGLITDSNIAKKLGAIRTRGVPAARLHASSVLDKNINIISPLTKVSDILSSVGEPGPTMLLVGTKENLVGVITKADLLPLIKNTTLIGDIMKQVVHMVSPDDRVIHARRQMIDADIARLPVVNNGILIGMISDIDIVYALDKIKKGFPLGKQKHQLEELLVHDAMSSPAITISKTKTVADAAKKMIEHHVGCLLVVQNEKILGIVTRTDLLKTIKI